MAKVLIVDDDLETADVIERILTASGHNVVKAGPDGSRAIDALNGSDIALVETSMLETDGVDLIRKLITVKPGLRVIAMSRSGCATASQMALLNGAVEILDKPFRVPELAFALDRALEPGQQPGQQADD